MQLRRGPRGLQDTERSGNRAAAFSTPSRHHPRPTFFNIRGTRYMQTTKFPINKDMWDSFLPVLEHRFLDRDNEWRVWDMPASRMAICRDCMCMPSSMPSYIYIPAFPPSLIRVKDNYILKRAKHDLFSNSAFFPSSINTNLLSLTCDNEDSKVFLYEISFPVCMRTTLTTSRTDQTKQQNKTTTHKLHRAYSQFRQP